MPEHEPYELEGEGPGDIRVRTVSGERRLIKSAAGFLACTAARAIPAFRALVAGDIPQLAHSSLSGLTAGDDHTQYRLESADHSHASAGLQGGTVSHDVLTGVSSDDHHAQSHGASDHTDRVRSVHVDLAGFAAIGGAPDLAQRGSAASVLSKTYGWAFDGAADETIQYRGLITFPKDILDTSAVSVILTWAPSDGTAGNVYWRVSYAFLGGTDQIDEATSAVDVITATPAVADQRTNTTLTTAAKVSTDTQIKINISRLASSFATDTYDNLDAWLVGVELQYNADM